MIVSSYYDEQKKLCKRTGIFQNELAKHAIMCYPYKKVEDKHALINTFNS